MNTTEQLIGLKSGLFVVPDSIDDGIEMVEKIAKGSQDPFSVYFAVQIILNSIANQLSEES